jgi:hypothetical protein
MVAVGRFEVTPDGRKSNPSIRLRGVTPDPSTSTPVHHSTCALRRGSKTRPERSKVTPFDPQTTRNRAESVADRPLSDYRGWTNEPSAPRRTEAPRHATAPYPFQCATSGRKSINWRLTGLRAGPELYPALYRGRRFAPRPIAPRLTGGAHFRAGRDRAVRVAEKARKALPCSRNRCKD